MVSRRFAIAARSRAFLILLIIMLGGVTLTALGQLPLPAKHPRHTMVNKAFNLPQFEVAIGTDAKAKKYYQETVAPQMKFFDTDPAKILTSNLSDLLNYFGYAGVIRPSELHALTSDDLMAKSLTAGDILATRFFAPKITTVSDTPKPIPDGGFGWRKLVRLKARPGSPADVQGIGSLLFLQNSFEKTGKADPFDPNANVAFFNQAMAVRTRQPVDSNQHLAMYFLTYGALIKLDNAGKPLKDAMGNFQDDAPLILSLKATFDSRDPDTGLPVHEYFVPDACNQCHGGRSNPKANFLDTDHWQDRVTPQYGLSDPRFQEEDFTSLATASYGPLFDAGKDVSAAKYKKAFDVFRRLNTEIHDQNVLSGGVINFQAEAAKKWLDLHALTVDGDKHVPPYKRGFGTALWDPNSDAQRKLLYYLNRYCYRCHSSVKYDVFDRAAVELRSSTINPDIQRRMQELADPNTWMPQDRPMPGLNAGSPTGALKEFLELLQAH